MTELGLWHNIFYHKIDLTFPFIILSFFHSCLELVVSSHSIAATVLVKLTDLPLLLVIKILNLPEVDENKNKYK